MSFRLGVDIGGTFTDLVVLDEDSGTLDIAKSPTTPPAPIEGVLNAIDKRQVNLAEVAYFVHGTTAATNAVVQRKGARVGLITTQGFRDILEIMRAHREFHYDLQWQKPAPLAPRHLRLEVPERVDYKGREVRPLDEAKAREVVRQLKGSDVEAIAVCFIFSFMNPAHEKRMKEIIKEEWPEVYVSISSEILPEIREYERTSTVVIDAYVKPLINGYMNSLGEGLKARGLKGDLMVMCSGGGVVTSDAAKEIPVYTLSSGPAGGVIGTVHFGNLLGVKNLIAMDMGGTSFDVSLVDRGRPTYHTEAEIQWGVPFKVPMIDVKSIGAGGGSIAWIDQGGLLRVGPQSSGAEPGPVCYRRGGVEPTVTDAYVTLGVIDPTYFLGGETDLDKEGAEKAIRERVAEPLGMGLVEAAQGIIDIAHANMGSALYNVSIQQGYDPRDFVILAYGGAGPMVAGALAEELGVKQLIVPMYPGAFSALGMLLSDIRFDYVHSYLARINEVDIKTIDQIYEELELKGRESLAREGFAGEVVVSRSADIRYVGQNFEVNTPVPSGSRLVDADLPKIIENFNREHEKLYGHSKHDEPVEFVSLRVTAVGITPKPKLREIEEGEAEVGRKGTRKIYFKKYREFVDSGIYERSRLPASSAVVGPAVIEEMDSTVVIEPGHEAVVDRYGNLVITLR